MHVIDSQVYEKGEGTLCGGYFKLKAFLDITAESIIHLRSNPEIGSHLFNKNNWLNSLTRHFVHSWAVAEEPPNNKVYLIFCFGLQLHELSFWQTWVDQTQMALFLSIFYLLSLRWHLCWSSQIQHMFSSSSSNLCMGFMNINSLPRGNNKMIPCNSLNNVSLFL